MFIVSHINYSNKKEFITPKTIRIDDDVYSSLKKIGETFEDTPNSVIKKLLIETNNYIKSDIAIPTFKGLKTTQETFEKYLLFILWNDFRGKGTKMEITEKTIEIMKKNNILSDADFNIVKTGETRAVNTIAWARNSLKNEGKISSTSLRGIWELTENGVKEAKSIVL